MLRPPGAFVPPHHPSVHADTRSRLLRDEQRDDTRPHVPRFCLTATKAVSLSGYYETDPWSPWLGAIDLEFVVVHFAGTGTLTLRDSEWTQDFDLPSDGSYRFGDVSHRWGPGALLDLTFSGSATRLMVQMWFRGEGGGGLVFSSPGGGG